jgi:hypothetical protein
MCHTTRTWSGATFDHSLVTTGCVSCHNGSISRGKPNDHPPSSNNCEDCHSTRGWGTGN